MRRLLILALLIASCDHNEEPVDPAPVTKPGETPNEKAGGEPDRIEVRLALIGGPNLEKRTEAETKELAEKLYQQVVKGADFPEIIRRFSVKKLRHPGGIGIVNHGVKRLGNDYSRRLWESQIGGAVFALEIDEVTLVSRPKSGWFIIKRLK